MELRLPVDADGGANAERQLRLPGERRVDAGAPHGRKLPLQDRNLLLRLRVHVVARALEVAVDPALLHDRRDLLERFVVRSRVAARGVEAERVHQIAVDEAVADRQLRRRVAGRAVPDAAALEQRDANAFAREQVRGRHAGDAGADDRDVDVEVAGQRQVPDVGRLEPVRAVEPGRGHPQVVARTANPYTCNPIRPPASPTGAAAVT